MGGRWGAVSPETDSDHVAARHRECDRTPRAAIGDSSHQLTLIWRAAGGEVALRPL